MEIGPSPDSFPSTPPPMNGVSSSSNRDNWREEEAELRHQLRLCRAELANCQAKLGVKPNHAPFGSSSARQTSLSPSDTRDQSSSGRKASFGDTRAASTPSPTPDTATSPSPSSSPRIVGLPSPGSVALGRALVPDEANSSTSRSKCPHPTPPPKDTVSYMAPTASSSRASNGSQNPFFGSGSSRERLNKSAASAQSGSGKVISGLQSDLLQARTALESTRGQLRLSQRAVESLTRQKDDLQETKARLLAEIDSLDRTLSRKERMQDEALGRARVAEAALADLQQAHRVLTMSSKSKIKELEAAKQRSDEARAQADSAYGALSRGMKTMSEGWRDDLAWVKADMSKSVARCHASSSAVSKVVEGRADLQKYCRTALHGLADVQQNFRFTYAASSSAALKEVEDLRMQSKKELARVESLQLEFARLRRTIASHDASSPQ